MSKLAKALTAAAGNAGESLYVEDVFSTYLYEGNGSAMTITNGIDLSGEGGLVWIKNRDTVDDNVMFSPTFGANKMQRIKTDALETVGTDVFQSFNSNGFTHGGWGGVGGNGNDIASWTFRKAEKFFDVVTYTGDGVAGREIAHNLGSVPACIIVKRTDSAGYPWVVYHTSIGNDKILQLNDTAATQPYDNWYSTDPTSSVFTINSYGSMNASGGTYVAYLFASDAGGFGDDGSESIISCGTFTTDAGQSAEVTGLGWEPQYVLHKNVNLGNNWNIHDSMRGMPWGSYTSLAANTSAAEVSGAAPVISPTADGFLVNNANGSQKSIYIAIRRPMKTPESGTEVFAVADDRLSPLPGFVSGFPVDFALRKYLSGTSRFEASARLMQGKKLNTATTDAEETDSSQAFDYMDGWYSAGNSGWFSWMFKRATGFFDVVAYTGDRVSEGGPQTITHNLKVIPELAIVKERSGADPWYVASTELNNYEFLTLNTTNGLSSDSVTPYIYDLAVNNFKVGARNQVNATGSTYIAYLFATVAGVSKVGSYTGTGADLNVDCGFSAGARFILIKRTDSTGDWYVWDSARGIVAGNDPYLLLNSTAAEVTSTDYIDPLASGFTVTSSAPAALNASGGSFVYLAIA